MSRGISTAHRRSVSVVPPTRWTLAPSVERPPATMSSRMTSAGKSDGTSRLAVASSSACCTAPSARRAPRAGAAARAAETERSRRC
eukprot:SAG22_NODE_4034_length_1414_cov_2.077567_1_plen_85_part_10